MDEEPPKRVHLKSFLPVSVCKELQFIHKSCSVAGYRPHVLSTTLPHLIATNCSSLIIPFIPIRDGIKDLVEEVFRCEFELFVEFTGLISWTKGAKIGWHSDNGRIYLKQRHFTAVCYLNSHAVDFHGGLFHFHDGSQKTISPEIGDVLIYRAEDVHCVDEVVQGERCTLALWFTKDSSCDEDVKLLTSIGISLQKSPLEFCATINKRQEQSVWMPVPPSSSMYVVGLTDEDNSIASPENRTLHSDLRVARSAELGFNFCIACQQSPCGFQEIEGCCEKTFLIMQDALENPVMLKSNKEVFPYVFANSVHALQVLYFCAWKESDRQDFVTKAEEKPDVEYVADSMAGSASKQDIFCLHLKEWEQYMTNHYESLQRSLTIWNQYNRISAIFHHQ